MTTTSKSRNPKNRLTRAIATVAIATALGGATYGISTSPGTRQLAGFSTSPGRSGQRPGDGNSPLSYQVAAVRTRPNGESRPDNHQNDIVLMRKAGGGPHDF